MMHGQTQIKTAKLETAVDTLHSTVISKKLLAYQI
jgi:hypothetical protein